MKTPKGDSYITEISAFVGGGRPTRVIIVMANGVQWEDIHKKKRIENIEGLGGLQSRHRFAVSIYPKNGVLWQRLSEEEYLSGKMEASR